MKNILNIKAAILVLVLFMSVIISAQEKHVITLYVDTANITMQNIESTCNFGQDPRISNEDFTVEVKRGDIVEWRGESTSSESDKVEIRLIQYSSGTNFFDRESLKDRNGIVTAQVVAGEPGDYEKYDLEFKVIRDGRTVRETFPIDPKLRMRPAIIDGE